MSEVLEMTFVCAAEESLKRINRLKVVGGLVKLVVILSNVLVKDLVRAED